MAQPNYQYEKRQKELAKKKKKEEKLQRKLAGKDGTAEDGQTEGEADTMESPTESEDEETTL
jgi:hypothetical protein